MRTRRSRCAHHPSADRPVRSGKLRASDGSIRRFALDSRQDWFEGHAACVGSSHPLSARSEPSQTVLIRKITESQQL